ncbi:hypothetical protein [Streptomyces sp. S.PB5]|uniref:hypothetical protein n=1 Tax=Streptomyces sp. S.PB5 TaxID=3020844 RepID=UPI0025B0D049|nr:hypothetical protein [Streptomyces sp. S.PB5]MDN3026200.1 hypothetical protein [Streptomyces sp. S.PB5]
MPSTPAPCARTAATRTASTSPVRTAAADTRVQTRWDAQFWTARVVRQVGERWEPADFLDVMWFAWHAFHRTGDAWDTAAIAATLRRVRDALAVRRHRRAALITAALTLLAYLFCIGDLAVSGSGRVPGAQPCGPHQGSCLRRGRRICSSRSSAVAAHTARHAASCQRTRYARLLGMLPEFLLGFACCVPTFLLVLDASTAAALLPALILLRPAFYALTLLQRRSQLLQHLVETAGVLLVNAARLTDPA